MRRDLSKIRAVTAPKMMPPTERGAILRSISSRLVVSTEEITLPAGNRGRSFNPVLIEVTGLATTVTHPRLRYGLDIQRGIRVGLVRCLQPGLFRIRHLPLGITLQLGGLGRRS